MNTTKQKGSLVVLEVNAWPNYHPYARGGGFDVARLVAAYLAGRAR